ncbi:ABC transporter substrate-binding protein [Cellulosilyticum sp. ST5]|uniref:ABC transporter substrate-binding protein n=1 Tax=Cellulosilyticum sp. ST5 TaxID=3055805 RepID=UPI0039775410
MKMTKKAMSLMLAATMLGSVVTGCSSSKGDTSTPSTEGAGVNNGEKVELTIGISADPVEVDLVTQQAEAYMEKNPNVKLVVEPIAGDIWEVLKTRMVSNAEPDIFYMDIFQAAQFIDAGKLASLDDLFTPEELADFEPALVNGFKGQDGVLYGIPKDFSTLALYYNKKMFEEAGITPPTTWEELESAAKALTKDGVVGLSLQNGIDRVQPFFYSNGGSMLEDGKPTLNNPKNIEAYEFWLSLLKNGYAQTPQQLGVGWDGDAFAGEHVAMTVEGTWMIANLQEIAPDLEYGVVPVPQKEQPASMQFTVAYSMSKSTKNPDVAKDVIKFLTSEEQQKLITDAGRAMPSRKSSLEAFVQAWPDRKVFAEAAPVASEFNYGVISSTVVAEAAKAMEKLLLDSSITVKEAFDEAQANIDKALSNQ